MNAVLALLRRDLLLAVRQQADVYNTLLFFVVALSTLVFLMLARYRPGRDGA